MEINKNTFLRNVAEIQKKHFLKQEAQEGNTKKAGDKIRRDEGGISFHKLRGKVRELQGSLNKLQSELTVRQSALKYTEEIMSQPERRELIQNFIEHKIPAQKKKFEEKDFHGIRALLMEQADQLKEKLLSAEVRLENMMASGLVGDAPKEVPIFKDEAQAQKVFSAFNEISARNIIKDMN